MRLAWEQQGNWFDREFRLESEDGDAVEEFGEHPTLNELREAERRYGERINLWQAGLVCTDCGNAINDRFSADPQGHLLCWECAMDQDGEKRGSLQLNADPTKAVLSESSLHEKSLCDYVINVATGCRHGCKFCYVPKTPAVENREDMLEEQADVEDAQLDWGSYLLYRDDLPERLHNELEQMDEGEWKQTARGRGVVMLSSGTDCYQDRRAAQITRGCVHELVEHGTPVRILTRSPNVLRDADLFQEADGLVTVGSSIPSFDTELVKEMEPNAPPPKDRWEALDELRKNGVPVYVSMSPTYPTMDEHDFWNLLSFFKALDPEVVFHEPINPRGANFEMCMHAAQEADYDELADELAKLQDHEYWVDYALNHIDLVHKIAEELEGLEIHSWPDRQLVNSTNGDIRRQLKKMRQSVSPEAFVVGESSSSEYQSRLGDGDTPIRA